MSENFFGWIWHGLTCHLKNYFADPIGFLSGHIDWCSANVGITDHILGI